MFVATWCCLRQAQQGPYQEMPEGYMRQGIGARSSARGGRKVRGHCT